MQDRNALVTFTLIRSERQSYSAHRFHITLDVQGHPNTARRDELVRYQKEAQKRWQEDRLFEVDAPAEGWQYYYLM